MGSKDNPNQTTEAKDQLIQELLSLMESAAHRMKNERHKLAAKMNLAEGQLFLLIMLSKWEICKASDIATYIGITSGGVTGLTDKLVHLGLVHRERSEEDRRVVLFSLTVKGQEIVDKIMRERNELFHPIVADFPQHELSDMVRLLKKMNGQINESKTDKE